MSQAIIAMTKKLYLAFWSLLNKAPSAKDGAFLFVLEVVFKVICSQLKDLLQITRSRKRVEDGIEITPWQDFIDELGMRACNFLDTYELA